MEILTAIVATLLAIIAPVGTVVDSLAANAIREQLAGAEHIQVRVDNVPNFQILRGRINQPRVAGRGIYLRQLPDLRIAAIDLETDVVDLNVSRLQRGELALDEPAQAALRLRLQADDVNTFLQSAQVDSWLETLRFSLPGAVDDRELNRYGLANPSVVFLEGDRLRVMVDLQDRVANEDIAIALDLGLALVSGHRFQLVDPVLTADGEDIPPQLLAAVVDGISDQLTLKRLETLGLIARVLEFRVRDNQLDLAIFAKIESTSPLLAGQTAPQAVPSSP